LSFIIIGICGQDLDKGVGLQWTEMNENGWLELDPGCVSRWDDRCEVVSLTGAVSVLIQVIRVLLGLLCRNG